MSKRTRWGEAGGSILLPPASSLGKGPKGAKGAASRPQRLRVNWRPTGTGMRDLGGSAERRIITVLSADIVGSTDHIFACDPDDAQAFYDHCFELVRRAVERASGTIVSYGGDGGLAAFGWPASVEDHADRACAAAWEIQHTNHDRPGPDGRPIRFRVGVHSGLVALRQIRRKGRSRLDTSGATVNIAAKLQQHAPPGEVLVSAEAARLCRTTLKLAPHDASAALRTAETSAFRLDGEPRGSANSDLAGRYPFPIVGREAELGAIRAALPGVARGGRSFAVVGEAGIGKSRLAAAVVAEAQARDIRAHAYFGDPLKRTTPLAVVRGMFEDLLHLSDDATRRDRQVAIDALALDEDDKAAVEALLTAANPRRREMLTQSLVNGFLRLAGDAPTLLLLEDLHLVDPESRQFVARLIETGAGQPLLVLVTARTEAADDARQLVGDVVFLEPLPTEAMTDL
ncbi:MAG TPA: AAA family ATPase, partial [Phenylobacterium sp.]